jgi:hypothetical protein
VRSVIVHLNIAYMLAAVRELLYIVILRGFMQSKRS